MGSLTWQASANPTTPTAICEQCPGLLRLGIPGCFGLECEHSLQPQQEPHKTVTAAHCGCSREWGREAPQVQAKPHRPLVSSDLGQLLGLSQADAPQQSQVQCPWEPMREEEEMTVRKCLVLGANERQETPLLFFMSCNSTTAGQASQRC